MAFLTPEQLESLRIERMIFHVVGADQLVLLEEMAPGAHTDFFVERIRSTNGGLMFDFVDSSGLLAGLRAIEADANVFTQTTKDLAEVFKLGHGRSASAGVFMVFVLSSGTERFYALVKYDHETVMAYKIEETRAGMQAMMSALQDTFVKSPEALQKSAIIRLTPTGGELCIRDRSAPTKVSQYFTVFLGAKRRYEADQLTVKLSELTRKVARENDTVLTPEILSSLNQRIYTVMQNLQGFDPADKEPFLAAVFGPLPADSKVRVDFDKALKTERIESESFDFDRSAVKRPTKSRLTTTEGIQIIWDKQYDENVRREALAGGRVRITIETGGVRVDDDYSEKPTRAR